MVEPAADRRVGWREVGVVAVAAVAVVLGAAVLTSVLPFDLQRLIFHTPLLIGVLAVVTALVLWRAATRQSPDS